MYETEEAGFLVVLQKPILDHFNLYRSIPIHPNERFIATSNSDKDMVGKTFIESPGTHVYSYEEMVKSLKALPLALGLRSGATFGYLLTTVLSLVGVGFNFYLSTSQRTVNYGVLRAIGLSPWQLYGSLLLEQVLLVVSGLTLGTVLGIALNQLTLPGLPIRLGELANIPPTIPRMNWSAVIGIYITLTIGYIVSIGIGTFFLWRMKIHRVIRIGEE